MHSAIVMETIFDYQISDAGLQEQIRAEVLRLCPGRTDVEFGPQIRIVSEATVDRRRVEDAIGRLRYIRKSVEKDRPYESSHAPLWDQNPLSHLQETHQVVEVSEGQYLLQGEFLGLMNALDGLVVRLANQWGAVEQTYPTFVPVDLLKRINYFKDFPHHIMVAAPLQGRQETLERFAAAHDFSKTPFDTLATDGVLQPVELVAAPSVCYPCYYGFRNRQLPGNGLFTAKSRCSRNEPSGFRALARLRNFTMREIMVLGDREFVLHWRKRMVDAMRAFMEELGLGGRIESANDLFFTNDAAYKAVFQHSFKLKYECQAYLPFSKEYLAVASVNLHNDTYGKAFRVTLADGSPMQSACIGFGLERWAYALLCQYGWDRAKWPDSLRRTFPETIS